MAFGEFVPADVVSSVGVGVSRRWSQAEVQRIGSASQKAVVTDECLRGRGIKLTSTRWVCERDGPAQHVLVRRVVSVETDDFGSLRMET